MAASEQVEAQLSVALADSAALRTQLAERDSQLADRDRQIAHLTKMLFARRTERLADDKHPKLPLVWDEPGSYVTTDHPFEHTSSASWNHGLGEIMTALLDRGLTITGFEEHDSVPWDALPGMMEQLPNTEYRLRDRPERLPHTYTLQARNPA